MHRTKLVCGLTALFLTTGIVVVAADQGRGSAPKVKHQTATAPKATAPKAPSVKSAPTVKPVSGHTKIAQPKATHTTKAAPPVKSAQATKPVKPAASTSAATVKAAATKPAKAVKPETAKATKVEKPAATAPVAGTTTGSTTTLSPVQQKLAKNTNLAAKLTSRLPAGTDLVAASAGFKNLGQFVAAVNVSNNLGLSFTQLKTKIVTDGMSLGQAIQAVRPLTASATIEAQRAEYDARGMIAESELTPQAPAPVPTSSKKIKAKTSTR